jgi:Zn-finger nucleic acid-binding protein
MRQCPKCKVDFQAVKKTFAEIDVCPQCAGAFLDPGEGVAVHGQDAEASFLVREGRAHIVRKSPYQCPSTLHVPTQMDVHAVGHGPSAIEIDYCSACGGFFLDHGEGAALDALEAEEVKTSSGAKFSAPPPVDRQAQAIEQARAGGGSFFGAFAEEVLRFAAAGAAVVADGVPRRHPRRRRWLGP